jgi:hypothetical protein
MEKYPIDPARIRHLPPRFSWLDQRLVSERLLSRCPRHSQALYLFLAVVSDASGLSYYSDRAICAHLAMEPAELASARHALIELSMLLFERPLYQLTNLDPDRRAESPPRAGRALRLSELIQVPELRHD